MLVKSLPKDPPGITFVLHDGQFHAHEVFVCALHKPDFIIRTRDYKKYLLEPNIAIIDQGMELSSEKVKTDLGMAVNKVMDHHQYKGFKSIEAMFGKLGSISGELEFLLTTIGMNDCGEPALDIANSVIKSFNPSWENETDEDIVDNCFIKALKMAELMISNPEVFIYQKSSEIAREEAKSRAIKILNQTNIEHGFMFLDKFMPFHEYIAKKPEITLVGYPTKEGYNLYVANENMLAKIKDDHTLVYPITHQTIRLTSFRSMMELVEKINHKGE